MSRAALLTLVDAVHYIRRDAQILSYSWNGTSFFAPSYLLLALHIATRILATETKAAKSATQKLSVKTLKPRFLLISICQRVTFPRV
jgi:uncharacterized membrane protein